MHVLVASRMRRPWRGPGTKRSEIQYKRKYRTSTVPLEALRFPATTSRNRPTALEDDTCSQRQAYSSRGDRRIFSTRGLTTPRPNLDLR